MSEEFSPIDRSMKWVIESSPAAVTQRSRKTRKNSDFAALRRLSTDGEELDGGGARVRDKVSSLVCTTTPCPTVGWPLVTWKGSGAHVPLSIQAKLLEPLLAVIPRLCF
ncbi:unnamed protein product [Spirodela intermedia]|uniref:Uncharacterized protein n=1 Tax=Spirodela intermedia TaxID=51605 RepID=A0A7I8JIQ7_SPIIN|nr:unnamed protein product [Spirodela intermedia]CAA6670019.1 unnamed protein product [Spirodela intermedia]